MMGVLVFLFGVLVGCGVSWVLKYCVVIEYEDGHTSSIQCTGKPNLHVVNGRKYK